MLIARRPESSHWYLKDGTPYYEVPKKDGTGLRPVNIRDAFKAGAYRSVTNVLSVVAKPGLVKWQIEQGIIAALTLPREPGEADHDFAERVSTDAEEQTRKAAELGTRLHDAASLFLTNVMPADTNLAKLLTPFCRWANANIVSVLASESVVVNHEYGYAGRLDMVVRLGDGTTAVMDIKSQDLEIDSNGNHKPKFYDEWPLQLAAYAKCDLPHVYDAVEPKRLMSIVIGRNEPGIYVKEWTNPRSAGADCEKYMDAFRSACGIWAYLKGGVPGLDKEAA